MNEDFYISLLYKKLNGEISPEEQQQLEDWQGQSEANQSTADAVIKAWEISTELSRPLPTLNLDDEFAQMMGKMEERTETPIIPINRKKRRMPNWWAIAAAVILIPSLFFLVQNLGSGTGEVKIVEVQTGGSEKQEITLPDNTTVYLNEYSVLKYPEKFKGSKREIEFQGEAFFEVEHNPRKPFIVQTPEIDVQVLGTEFNVEARPNFPFVNVLVSEGKVAMKKTSQEEEILINAGQSGNYNRQNKDLSHSNQLDENALAWKTGKLVFNSITLREIISTLESYYKVEINILDPTLGNCTFDDSFDNLEIDEVLDILATVFTFESEKTGARTYQLKGGSCQ